MTQPAFDWTAARELPTRGKTSRAKHASATGAAVASRRYGRKVLAYLSLLRTVGRPGVSDFQAAALLNMQTPLVAGPQSICSIRDGLGDLIEHTGQYDRTEFGSKRGRYRLSAAGQQWMEGRS